ncbi:MAG: DUF421 domain-containing protein [Bacillota bacterium]|nr:DUF421 domain-containing protein [Bacillota bacterium]
MELLNVVLSSVISIIALFISVKLIGNRQMSELNMFDYINGITIGSIAAELATSLEGDFLKPLIAIIIYTVVVIAISTLSSKSVKLRRFFSGKSWLLMDNGKIYQKNFTKSKLDLSEFLTQCRVKGFFNTNDIETAFLEQNGRITILPKANKRPVTPYDMNLAIQEDYPFTNVIMDGHIMSTNLKHTGNSPEWLIKELAKQGYSDIKQVFLACCDKTNTLYVFKKINEVPKNDMFQ